MIAYLKGNILAKDEQSIILNVNDIGYQVLCDERSLQTLSGETELFIYHQVREDAEVLFGFKSLFDRRVFVLLMTVSGIGPKSALNFLSGYSAEQLVQAIARGDLGVVSSISGVGKKTAEKVIVELKDKVIKLFPEKLINVAKQAVLSNTNTLLEESFKLELDQALRSLGYAPKEIESVISKNATALAETTSVEQALKVILRNL